MSKLGANRFLFNCIILCNLVVERKGSLHFGNCPVYKVEAYLSKCIDSILAQSFSDFELLLIDDGSLDNSGAVLTNMLKKIIE